VAFSRASTVTLMGGSGFTAGERGAQGHAPCRLASPGPLGQPRTPPASPGPLGQPWTPPDPPGPLGQPWTPPASPGPLSQPRTPLALTDAAEGDDPVLAGRAAGGVADTRGHDEGFGVLGAGWHLHAAKKLLRLGEVAASLLRGVLGREPARDAAGLWHAAGSPRPASRIELVGTDGKASPSRPPAPGGPPAATGAHLCFTQSVARVPGDGFARSGHSHRTSFSWLRR